LHYFPEPVLAPELELMPLVEGTSEPDSGWLVPPELAPAASIGAP
jgi:hypothetical protein